jgi:putative intracellular protease/amidase
MKQIIFLFGFISFGISSFSQAELDNKPKTVGILLFDGVQIIDYTAPYEILSFSFDVFTVAPKKDTIKTWRGMKVIPDYGFDNAPTPDILVIPGGNISAANKNFLIHKWIIEQSKHAMVVMSVCNGAYFLAKTGLLDSLDATTTSNLIESLQDLSPKAHVVRDKRFVDNGKIITTAGFSSGIDGALHIISRYYGSVWAKIIARRLEYDWKPESKYAAGSLADCNVYKVYKEYLLGDELNGEPVKYEGDNKYWESETLIKTTMSADSLLVNISNVLINKEKWQLQKPAKQGVTNYWIFTGKDKKSWKGTLSIKTMDNKDQLRVYLAIKRNI